jgi:hypothetical protein
MESQRHRIATLFAERHATPLVHKLNRDAIRRAVKVIRAVESGNVYREACRRRALRTIGLI